MFLIIMRLRMNKFADATLCRRLDRPNPLRFRLGFGLRTGVVSLCIGLLLAACATTRPGLGALASWRDGPTKQAIIEFVEGVTKPDSPGYVAPAERIAVFDNDGTLWSEKPTYFQLMFAMDRIRDMAGQHPQWRDRQPFKAVLEDDMEALKNAGEAGMFELVMATHGGMSTDEFERVANDWLASARHPRSGRKFTEMVYKPMLELLDYLRAHDFKVFIVSGAGIEFMRPWTEAVYGIPPEQVVGTSLEATYLLIDGVPTIIREPKLHFVDDKAGKPVAINRFIGRRPILAIGNSDGDYEMLEWTTSGDGPRLGMLLHHTDAQREWAYDRHSAEGRLDRGLDDAPRHGWLIIDMARDWNVTYPFELAR